MKENNFLSFFRNPVDDANREMTLSYYSALEEADDESVRCAGYSAKKLYVMPNANFWAQYRKLGGTT